MAFDCSWFHRTKNEHFCNNNKIWTKKRSYDPRYDGVRKDYRLNPLELASLKNVIVQSRSSGLSYHKIAKAFGISSRTVFNWVGKIFAIPRRLIHVNIKAIALAYFSYVHAYRNGSVQGFNIENIMNGVGIH